MTDCIHCGRGNDTHYDWCAECTAVGQAHRDWVEHRKKIERSAAIVTEYYERVTLRVVR